jgi:asparaginyl-tRNA synthetase
MIEPEVAFNDSDDNMRLQEDFVSFLVRRCLGPTEGGARGARARYIEARDVVPPFVRLDYTDAITLIQRKGSETKWGEDLGAEDESLIVEDYDRPVFVMNYPKEAKAFYMKENPADPRARSSVTICWRPEGYGEIIGGSQREDDHDKLLARIKEEGLPLDAYGWYSISESTGRSCIRASALASSARSPGSAALRTSARRRRFRD